jgi:hypothetical protein
MCAFSLLTDIADDGYIGKAPLFYPQLPGNISFTSAPDGPDNVVSAVWIPPEKPPFIFQRGQNQLHLAEFACALRKSACFLISSSGGLPL